MATPKVPTVKQVVKAMPSISDQGALVNAILKPTKTKEVEFVIPGGHNLFASLKPTISELRRSVYTWIRASNEWTALTLYLAKDMTKYTNKVSKFEYPVNITNTPPWRIEQDGLQKLAERIADILYTGGCASIEVSSKGISIAEANNLKPGSDNWLPRIVFSGVRKTRSI